MLFYFHPQRRIAQIIFFKIVEWKRLINLFTLKLITHVSKNTIIEVYSVKMEKQEATGICLHNWITIALAVSN